MDYEMNFGNRKKKDQNENQLKEQKKVQKKYF